MSRYHSQAISLMPIFFVIVAILAVYGFFQFFSELSSCDGAVIETVNPFDPFACLPEEK